MKAVFADTSFWIALFSRRDQFHLLAHSLYDELRDAICTSDWVLVELANHAASRPSRSAIAAFVHRFKTDSTRWVIPATDSLFTTSLDLYARSRDKEWSLTDCSSFAIMREQKVSQALTADHHFEQAGFEILLK